MTGKATAVTLGRSAPRSAAAGTGTQRTTAPPLHQRKDAKRAKLKTSIVDSARAQDKSAAATPAARKSAPKKSATRDSILRAAAHVFSQHGYDGGSVEKISRRAKSVDRMIYYYFGSKEGLFVAVLEQAYQRMNAAEATLSLDLAAPAESLTAVIRFMLGYYRRHPEFVTLLNTENLHQGKHIVKSERAREYSSPAVRMIAELLEAGQCRKLFRADVDARDVYLLIAASGYFYMSNRFTLSVFLGEALLAPEAVAHWERFVTDTVLRAVRA